MRFLVYTLLFLFIPLVGFTQVKQAHVLLDSLTLETDSNKVLERNGNTPPPQVMAPTNDNCTSPVALSATGLPVLYPSNATATPNTGSTDPIPSCFNYTAYSVWYTYTTPATAGTLTLTIQGKTQKGSGIAIYSGNCGAFTTANELGCGQNTVIAPPVSPTVGSATATASCLTPNTKYYILVESATVGTYSITTTYSATAGSGPGNDCCSGATPIPAASLNGTTNISGTTVGATNDNQALPACNTSYNNVWYSFYAQGPNLEVTVNGVSASSPQYVVLSGTPSASVCTGVGTQTVMCNTSATGTVTGTNVGGTPLVKDSLYYISVTSGTAGTFNLIINNPVPNPPGTDCATATALCGSYVATNGNTNLWGYQDENGSTGDCIGTNGEIHSAWYYMSVLSGSGTLGLNITSATTNNYDFSVWQGTTNSSICDNLASTSTVSCNNSTVTTGGVTGIASAASAPINSPLININAGDLYMVLVNSPAIAGTYTITPTLTGTAILSCTTPVILPIQLADFTASQNGNEVDLKWSTLTEKNNSYFTIERSADGKTFEELDKVKSIAQNGNSTSILNYTDIDYAPLAGVSYYKLSQTDMNGKTTKLSIAPVINKDNDGAFTIAPNPTNGMLNITYNCQTATTGIFKLFDSNGAIILEQDVACALGNNQSQIDLSDKTNGIYFATFTTNTSFYRTKLIKK